MDKKNEVTNIDESTNRLFLEISSLIGTTKKRIYNRASSETVLLFWKIGKRINEDILNNERAEYGKKVVQEVAELLTTMYGTSFEAKNLRRMIQFSEIFDDFQIVVTLSRQLTWSHFLVLIPIKTPDARLFYANEAMSYSVGVRELRNMINRKAYERREIADNQLTSESLIPVGTFKDPYLFDVLGLKDEYLESDLEDAVLRELEKFILEFGKGFAFVARQKRMIIDGRDNHLDLLFYNRKLKRLVAVELKIRKFEAADNGQMKLYLNWLNRYERQAGEEAPIGIILCTESGREEIELLQMDKDGIAVAEYWTTVPPKDEFEQKIQMILAETRERLEARELLAIDENISNL